MTMTRVALITLFATACAMPAFAQTAAPQLSLDEAVALAIANNRRVANAALEVDQRSHDVESARATRLTVEYEVKRLYFAILQTESAIEAASHSLTLLHELSRVVADRVVQRTALDGDAYAVDVRLARAAAERDALINAAANQKEQLNQLLGRDIQTAFVTAGVPSGDPVIDDAAAVHTRALAARPDVRQARARLQQAELARQRARTDYLPDVSLALSYISPIIIDGAPRHIATAGVQLQWEPFDWGRRSHTVASRGLAVQQAANALREQEDQARLEVNARVRKLADATREVQVAALAQRAARETSRVRAAQYRVNAALLSDVLQAAASQAEGDHQYVQALAALWVARAEFERAIGEE
jgi:outer membrane protein TolC